MVIYRSGTTREPHRRRICSFHWHHEATAGAGYFKRGGRKAAPAQRLAVDSYWMWRKQYDFEPLIKFRMDYEPAFGWNSIESENGALLRVHVVVCSKTLDRADIVREEIYPPPNRTSANKRSSKLSNRFQCNDYVEEVLAGCCLDTLLPISAEP